MTHASFNASWTFSPLVTWPTNTKCSFFHPINGVKVTNNPTKWKNNIYILGLLEVWWGQLKPSHSYWHCPDQNGYHINHPFSLARSVQSDNTWKYWSHLLLVFVDKYWSHFSLLLILFHLINEDWDSEALIISIVLNLFSVLERVIQSDM